MRVRWSMAGRVLLAAGVVLLALRAAPALLKPPAPPPLPADVGLPRVAVAPPRREPVRSRAMANANLGRGGSGGEGRRRAGAAEGRVRAHKPRHPSARDSAKGKPRPPTRRQDPPVIPPVPPSEPPPPPVPAAESPPPPAPGDGSME